MGQCAWWEKSRDGLHRLMEVESDRDWNRFWVMERNLVRGKAHEGGSSRKTDRGLRFLGNWLMRRLRRSRAENGVGSGQP
jgi:hypothetical protein